MAGKLDVVLLVDDNKVDAILNKKVLEKEGIADTVLIYNNAQLALDYLISLDEDLGDAIPSAVFVDMMMPEMNGFQFVQNFDNLPEIIKEKCKIVFMSGSVLSQEQETRLGTFPSVIKFINKPLSINALNSVVEIITK